MGIVRFLTSGQSHGKCLNAIIEGIGSGYNIDFDVIQSELLKRQTGIARSSRMNIEKDFCEILSGIRHGKTTGAAISLQIKNKDYLNWKVEMQEFPFEETNENYNKIKRVEVSTPRPGHADLSGALKYNHNDIRNVIETSSARKTAIDVALGAVCQSVLKHFGIIFESEVLEIGNVDFSNKEKLKSAVDSAKANGDTLGGIFKISIKNLPLGLGSYVHWDKKLDALLSFAVMSVNGVKSVEFGLGKSVSKLFGSEMHDEIFYENGIFFRKTNNAGGIEGGMSNGETISITCAMKPIPTLKKTLKSFNLKTKISQKAHFERSDVCAVESCAIVAKNMCAIIILQQFFEKFGGDSFEETRNNFKNYMELIKRWKILF